MKLDNTTPVAYINKKGGPIQSVATNKPKTFGTGPKGKIFGSPHPMYLGLKILLLISGHVNLTIAKSRLSMKGLLSSFLFSLGNQ